MKDWDRVMSRKDEDNCSNMSSLLWIHTVMPLKRICIRGWLVGWLLILPPGVGWGIMGCESDPLPSYIRLRNCSYYIMLNYTDYLYTPQVHLPHPGSTIPSTGLFLASAPPWRIVDKWCGMPLFPIWLPATS